MLRHVDHDHVKEMAELDAGSAKLGLKEADWLSPEKNKKIKQRKVQAALDQIKNTESDPQQIPRTRYVHTFAHFCYFSVLCG